MTTSTIMQNELLLLSLISIFATIFLFQIIEIEPKFIINFLGDILKNVIAILVLSEITTNLTKAGKVAKEGFEVLNSYYENYILIISILVVFYVIDRLIEKKIPINYPTYIIYSIMLFLYTNLSLNKSLRMVVLTCLALFVFKMKKYKQVINKKYTDIKSISKFSYITYIIAGFILVYSSINSIINKSKYELVGIFILYYSFIWKKYRIKKKDKDKEKSKINELSDKEIDSVDKLFETRKKELEYIIDYFETYVDKTEEPFAMSISGKWGEGKSSLTNVLKKELEDRYIIFDIQPMVTDTREGLIKYFFSNLEKQFIYYGLSVGSGSSIENYFTSILKLIDSKGLLSIKQEVKNIKSNKFDLRESKEELQNDIKLLKEESKKNILIVVDDFDRVDNDVKYSILTFIKEVINFDGIKSLILLDYSILDKNNDSKITYEFLEKFINKRFDLSKLTVEEILSYYENTIIQKNDAKSEDYLNKELDELIKNISVVSNEIINNINNKLEKERENLKNLKKDEEKNKEFIINKEQKIKNLTNLESSLRIGIGNTRKVKRIIREIEDKVKYIKYAFSGFNSNEKKELTKNINVKNVIITMILIKVLYEKDYDYILKSKDMSIYIKNNKSTEVYELILCSIFNRRSEFEFIYGIPEKDYNLIKFINNVFICINTPEDICDFRNNQQKMLDIISSNPIIFEKGKTVFENIKDVYNKVDYFYLKDKMENLSEYMAEELKKGNIKLCDSIQLIKTHRPFDGITKRNNKYIKTLRKSLENKYILYNDSSQYQKDLNILNSCNMDLINSNINTIAFILNYKSIKSGELISYYNIIEQIEGKNSIKKVNDYAINFLRRFGQIEIDESCSETERLLKWVDSIELSDIDIDYKKIKKEISDMIETLQDLEFIKSKVENYKLEKKRTNYEDMNYSELMDILISINKDIDSKLKNDQIYNIILDMKRIVGLLSLEHINDVTKSDIEVLKNISSTIYNNYSFKTEDIEDSWRALQLQILIIKNKLEG